MTATPGVADGSRFVAKTGSSGTDATLVIGDPVITFGERGTISDGAVLCRDGRIEEVGRRDVLVAKYRDVRVIGSLSEVVLPGLINSHLHSDFQLDAKWLRYPIERGNVHVRDPRLNEEELYWSTVRTGLRCLRSGQTTVLDFVYGLPHLEELGLPVIFRAYADLGIRSAVAIALRDRNHYVHGSDERFLAGLPGEFVAAARSKAGYARAPDAALGAFRAMWQEGHGVASLSRLLLAPDWTPSVSDHLYRSVASLAAEFGTLVTTHAAETRLEVNYSLKEHGATPIARLSKLGVLTESMSCAHVTWTTADDHRLLREAGSVVVVNPGSNLRMGAGLPRAMQMRNSGVRVAIGTDGMALHHEDLLGEACLATYIDRDFGNIEQEPGDPFELIRDSQRHGATATGFGSGLGHLSEGAPAHIVTVRPRELRAEVGQGSQLNGYELIESLRQSTVTNALVGGNQVLGPDGPCHFKQGDLVAAFKSLDAVEVGVEVEDALSLCLDDASVAHYRGWIAEEFSRSVRAGF